ncbi:MAG: hypothetical protein JSU00_24360 [Acidobacteria bacterium]|nr:hypothetical protein [Acidobacteriota bacterium]
MSFHRVLAAAIVFALASGAAELTPEQRKKNADSFEYAWSKIRENMWAPMPEGLDWQAVHDELKPKAASARTMEDARAVMRDMIARLKLTHFNIVAADLYDELGNGPGRRGDGGSPGLDLRLVDGQALVVSVDAGSPAQLAGVRPGWVLVKADGAGIREAIRKLDAALPDSTHKELAMTRAVMAKIGGAPGSKVPVEFLDASNRPVKMDLEIGMPRGEASKIGFMPAQHVWFESRKVENSGYVRFNLFLDPARLSTLFANAVEECSECDGFIIDLRGNPGGIGGMAMGFAGWFVDRQGVRLGAMRMKGQDVKFAIFPRSRTFRGPLAILVDGLTASTSEILAGGLKDIGRARIFGAPTAGAALPSVFEQLPNNDGFQYAIADYISEGGDRLEGKGVTPDQPARWTRKALLAGQDPALDAALAWIRKGKNQ